MTSVWKHKDHEGINFYGEYVSADKYDRTVHKKDQTTKKIEGRKFRLEAIVKGKKKSKSYRSFQAAKKDGWTHGFIA